MSNLYARSVFFTTDSERSSRFYTEELGFSVDWEAKEGDRTVVFQVSLSGFELILNQTDERTHARAGHGRLFVGLEDDQGEPFRRHFEERRVRTERVGWGRPTLVVRDVDGNELFFWLPHDDFTGFETPT
jgi:catechol 2,3-dioxygenase-like lactoylglutathione lyase family enzyme